MSVTELTVVMVDNSVNTLKILNCTLYIGELYDIWINISIKVSKMAHKLYFSCLCNILQTFCVMQEITHHLCTVVLLNHLLNHCSTKRYIWVFYYHNQC